MTRTKEQQRGVVLMLICAALWSISGIFIKLIPWNSLVIAGWRSFIAAFCVIAYMKKSGLHFKLNKLAVLSGAFLCATFLCFVSANKLTTAANAIVLQYISPVFILVMSAALFKQHFSRDDVVAVLLTLAGISLFFFDQLSPGNLAGNLLGIFSGFFLACMFLASSRADDDARMTGILLGHILTAAIGLPMSAVFDTPVSLQAVLCILVLGVVQLGIPYILYGIAVKTCTPLVCSLLGTLEPLLNPVWVFLFDGEAPGVYALIGGAFVVVTITIWCIRRERGSGQT